MSSPLPLQLSSGNTANLIPAAASPSDDLAPSKQPPPINNVKSTSGPLRPFADVQEKQTAQNHIAAISGNENENEKKQAASLSSYPPPPYLLNPTEKDRQTLSIPDEEFVRDSWETVKKRVQENKLDEFKRVPSQLRRYLEYVYDLKQSVEYGGVQNFILRERLRWDLRGRSDTSSSSRDEKKVTARYLGSKEQEGGLFANAKKDVKILQNDWPYGIDERIVHLVVWTKFLLEDDEITGDLKPSVRMQVDEFVRRTFTNTVTGDASGVVNAKAPKEDEVIWFKNWSSIKSIHSVEHFHVMLFDPDPVFVDEVTGCDVPLWKKRKQQQA